jgi:hypothetical protein
MADSVIKYSDLIGEDDTFDVIFDNIDKLRKELTDLAQDAKKGLDLVNPNDEKALKSAVEQVEKLAKAKKKLDTEEKKAVKTKKKLNDLTDEELIQREKLKIANRERIQKAKQIAILTSKEAGEIEKLRARLSLTTLEWKKLSKEELNNTKKGKAVIATKLKLTNQLKKLEKQTGDTRRNVGNYTKSLGKLGKVAAGIFVGRNLVSALRNVGGAFVKLFQENTKGNEDFERFSRTIESLTSKLKETGIAILQAIIPVVEKGIRLFQFFSEKIAAASGEGTILGKVFEVAIIPIKAIISLIQDLPFLFVGIVSGAKQFASNVGDSFTKLGKELQIVFLNIEKINPFSEKSKVQIEANIKALKSQIDSISDSQIGVAQAFKNAYDGAKKEFEDFNKKKDLEELKLAKAEKRKAGAEKRRAEALEKQNKLLALQITLEQNLSLRVQAIVSLEKKIEQAETNAIVDKQERLLALEDLKAKALREQQEKDFSAYVSLLEKREEILIAFYGDNAAEVIAFREQAGKELLAAEANNLKLSELQLQESEDRKLKIYEDADKKRIDNATKIVKEAQKLRDKGQSDEEKFIEEQGKKAAKQAEGIQKGVEDEQKKTAEATKARTDELLKGIADTTAKIGAAIVATFEKQADAAGKLVEDQAAAVEVQRDRAEKGLSNTLKFEQEQLAQREAERIRAEKKAKQAAEFVTLLNLVSAYAAGGDANALARGLVDFSLLKALEAGFEEGGYTGDNGTSDIAGVVHGKEFVVTADDVKRYGLAGKSGGDFGEAMSDYFYSPLQQNLYNGQADNFKSGMSGRSNDFVRLEDEMRAMRRAFQAVPKNDFDILQMTDYFVDISKRVTSNRMTKVSKQRKRL